MYFFVLLKPHVLDNVENIIINLLLQVFVLGHHKDPMYN